MNKNMVGIVPGWGNFNLLLLQTAIGRYPQNIRPGGRTHMLKPTFHVCPIRHNKQLLLTGLLSEVPINKARMGVSSCNPNGVLQDKKFLIRVPKSWWSKSVQCGGNKQLSHSEMCLNTSRMEASSWPPNEVVVYRRFLMAQECQLGHS